MRLSPFALLTGAVALASAEILSETEEIKKEDTVSDGPAVPALLELTPTNWDTELKKTKYIFIKHFRYYLKSNIVLDSC
jgi:protein disulfide-isomerase